MSSNLFRLLTVLAGVATVVVGFVVAGQTGDASVKDILVPVGVGIIGWGTPHPADAKVAP